MVWINRLGYNKVILQHDQEDALKRVLEQVQHKLGVDRVQLQATPRLQPPKPRRSRELQQHNGRYVTHMVECTSGNIS